MSVGGGIGRRTQLWRNFAWWLGDSWADALCARIDAEPDPGEAASAASACVALVVARDSHSTDDIKTALAELFPGVDDILMAERRAPKRRAQVPPT